jgi:RNA polymerase sigma-70 factor (ECF subfamily)
MGTPEKIALVQRLFVQNTMAVRGFVVALLPDFTRVDDVVQETFLTASAKAEEFQEGTNFRSWVCSIARFKVLEAARRPDVKGVALDPAVIEALCAAEPDEAVYEEELRALQRCKDELAPQTRRIIDLRYEQAHRPPEVARTMGWTVNAVNVALSRARAALRDCVERQLRTQSGEL